MTKFQKYDKNITREQWYLVDVAIKAFISKFPAQWFAFERYMKERRTEYGLANKEHKSLRQANFRCVMEFPGAVNPTTGKENNLYPVIEKIIPGFTKDKKTKKEFLTRYPMFGAGEKY